MKALPRLALLSALALCGGCAGGGGAEAEAAKTFSGHGISFEYPADWDKIEDTSTSASTGNQVWNESYGLDATNLVAVSLYSIGAEVTTKNIQRFESDITRAIKGVVEQAGGSLEGDPAPLTVAGLPTLDYRASGITTVDEATVDSRIVLMFDGASEYFLNCQYTDAERQAVEDACQQVLDTFALD